MTPCISNKNRDNNYHGNKTHCPRGHEYSGGNLKLYGKWKRCRTCIRINWGIRDAKRKQAKLNVSK